MKTLLICGYFAEENEAEVIAHARAQVEFSANNFQKKLIEGLKTVDPELYVVSAPLIGSYPNASDIPVFRGFREPQDVCRYVDFHNLWGLRNISRAASLKKAVRFFAELEDAEKRIVVYCAHTPFLEAAAYAKKLDPRIRICFYVPDLPNYMNLSAGRSKLYDIAKAWDNRTMRRYMEAVDAFVVLTEPMIQCLPVGDKPCIVREGILERAALLPREPVPEEREQYLVYTGKLYERFGVKTLIDGFSLLENPQCRLVLCGAGDCLEYARTAAEKDSRILVLGQVTSREAAAWQRRAAVLVNPRPNNEEYTQYSFPSKNIEYLLTGKPVAACMLSGMPGEYREFLYEIGDDTPQALAKALAAALEDSGEDCGRRYRAFLDYARERLTADAIARSMMNMCK